MMSESCSSYQHREEEISSVISTQANLLDSLIELFEDCRPGRRSATESTILKRGQDSDSEYDSSDGSSEEGDGDRQPTESTQDLQQELSRLEISEEATTLETLIIIVEFYIKSGDIDGFRKNVRRPDMWLLTSRSGPKICDLTAMAVNFQKQNLPFRAVMMYKAVCALYKYEYDHHPSDDPPSNVITPNDAVCGIENTMEKVFDLFIALQSQDSSNLYLPHFVPILYDMLTNLREIRHADRKYRADSEAWGMLYISIVHGKLNENVEMHDVIETNTKTLERRFKKKAERLVVYGISLMTLAIAKKLLHQDIAGKATDAIKALQESKSLLTWEDKVKLVAKALELVKNLT